MKLQVKYFILTTFLFMSLIGCQSRTIKVHSNLKSNRYTRSSDEDIYLESLEEITQLQNRSSSSTVGNTRTTTHWQEKAFIALPKTRKKVERHLLKHSKKENILSINDIAQSNWSQFKIIRLTYVDFEEGSELTNFLQGMSIAFGLVGCLPLFLFPAFVPLKFSERLTVLAQVFYVNKEALNKRLFYMRGSRTPLFDERGLRPIYEEETILRTNVEVGFLQSFITNEGDYIKQLNKELTPQLIKIINNARSHTQVDKKSYKKRNSKSGNI